MTIDGSHPKQWVVLSVDSREYALPVNDVVEVLRMVAVTPMPEAPAWVAGVLNLRGKGIVVMDLRRRLGLPIRAPDLNSQIVIVEYQGEARGLIADEVIDVITLTEAALKPVDKLAGVAPPFAALAHAGARLIFVLDLDRLAGSATALDTRGVAHVVS